MSDASLETTELREFLLRARNADGGWGYQPGNTSRLEPTCWAVRALGPRVANPTVLVNWPTRGGLLLERPAGEPNYAFHAVALLALTNLALDHSTGNGALAAALSTAGGESLPESTINRQDNTLRGWSWIAGTFSWVEPTAWCLLALKAWQRAGGTSDPDRIDVGERLLIDRCCVEGGWNYGNSNMLGQKLKAFVPTTAVALLAMQDRTGQAEVQRSIDYLEREAMAERSGSALALALLALEAFRRPVSGVRDALVAQMPTTRAFGKIVAASLALYALSEREDNGGLVF